MIRIHLTNHGRFLDESFSTFAAALAAAKRTCFQVGFFYRPDDQAGLVNVDPDVLIASWCPIGGLRAYPEYADIERELGRLL